MHNMKKALCIGIDSYESLSDLHGCVNDANEVKIVLERNGDGTKNFDVKLLTATSESSYINRSSMKDAIVELFHGDNEISLLYFAGHGAIDEYGGYLCSSECKREDDGLSLDELMSIVSKSRSKNKVIILDSCFSGNIGEMSEMKNYSILKEGTTLLAACGNDEYSSEKNGHGVFTSLMVEALYGGAMNLLGYVTPAGVYSYVDQSLDAWEQRPVFKANIKKFICLRKNNPLIQLGELHRISEIFESDSDEFQLDPSYEPDKHESDDKIVNKEHEEIFSLLQKYVRLGLVVPVGEEHMYYAAIHSKTCKLTAQGQHYWKLVKENKI